MDVKLVVFKSNGQRKDIPFAGSTLIIGRGEECEVHVPVGSISRRHCELTLADETLSIKDLASSNGTYVNNARVAQTKLKAGDRVAVGPIVFTVQIDGEPAEIRPVKARSQQLAEGPVDVADDDEEILDLPAVDGDEVDALAMLADRNPNDDSDIAIAPPPAPPASSGKKSDPLSALEALSADVNKRKQE